MPFTLQSVCRAYAPALAKYADNRKIAENLRDGFPQPYTLAHAETFVKGCLLMGEGEQLIRTIVLDGEAVGTIGVFLRENREAELGYWLGEPFWGRGIMTGAVRRLCGEAFSRFDIDRIYAVPYVHNPASRRVLQKAGFADRGPTDGCGCSRGKVCLYTLERCSGAGADRRG